MSLNLKIPAGELIQQEMRSRIFLLLILCASIWGCGRVEQVVSDPDVFKELDALYTAVTSRRVELLQACHSRLKTLQEKQQLSPAGFQEISVIIEQAEHGEWPQSAERLYRFMRAQRKS